jgi:hypothetical protein
MLQLAGSAIGGASLDVVRQIGGRALNGRTV